MSREIPLTRGLAALVDDADFDALAQFNWQAMRNGATFYASRGDYRDGKTHRVSMHRTIMGEPKGMVIDHINHNGLDNRRSNLRVCLHKENLRNHTPHAGVTSPFLGVNWEPRYNKWRAQIRVNGKKTHIGHFDNEDDAARAYDAAARIHHSEFANLNFKAV